MEVRLFFRHLTMFTWRNSIIAIDVILSQTATMMLCLIRISERARLRARTRRFEGLLALIYRRLLHGLRYAFVVGDVDR